MLYTSDFDRLFLQRMNELFGPWSDGPALVTGNNGGAVVANAQSRSALLKPTIEMLEKDNMIMVNVELPGVKKENIQVHVENGQLSIMAERKEEFKEDRDHYHYSERRYGSMKRDILLPERTDPNNVKAAFENGVLTLCFAKKAEEANRKKITIA